MTLIGSHGWPLLQSKITPPGLPNWVVPRPRIARSIEDGVRQGMLTVISGPAGAGKTTALAAWAAESRRARPVAWFTVDEYDNQPRVFWRYLSAALSQAGILLPSAGDHVVVRTEVTSALAVQHPPTVLVLDNLHLLRGCKIADELACMLRQARPALRVIIAARGEPPLPLHQYLLTGDLTEIQTDQLAFTVPEARSLLGQHDLAGDGGLPAWLIRETEGWAAGLRLAAIGARAAAQARAGVLARVMDVSRPDHPVTAYLTREMIDPQPRPVRNFLLRTSVIDSFSPELARELTGQEHAAVTLTELVRASTFIQSTGEGWYRYHPLFAGVLRARLRDESPGTIDALRRQAAMWFARHGDLSAAVRYATRAGAWPLAARAVVDELAVGRLLDPDDGRELVRGLRDVPAAPPWPEPQSLVTAAGIALATRDASSCRTWLGRADHLLQGLTIDQEVPSRFATAVIRFELARLGGDPDGMYSAAAESETAHLRLPAEVRARHPELAVQVLGKLGTAELWLGRLDQAAKTLADAVALPTTGTAAEQAGCTGHLALAEALNGRLGRAEELGARVACRDSPNVAAEIALAWAHLERDEMPEVRNSLKQAETGLRVRRDRAAAAVACLVAVRLHLAEGRHQAAARMLERAREGWLVPAWLEHRLTLAEARVCAMAGNTIAALNAADRCGDDGQLDAAVARAAAWVGAGDFRAARRALRGAFEAVTGTSGRVLEPAALDALLLDARLRYANGDRPAGRHSLARALRIASSEEVRLPFAMEQGWLTPVLRTDAELAEIYLTLSRRAAGRYGPQAAGEPDGPPVIEPLTGREHEVLSRVAQLMSTAEIANELCISVNTVKTHLKSVHRKLAVAHRREAVRRARQLKLL